MYLYEFKRKEKYLEMDLEKRKAKKTSKANEKLVNRQIVEKSATHRERWIWRYRVSIRSRSSYWLVIRRDRETSGCSCNQNSCAAARHHRPRVSADYDSSTREHRERVKRVRRWRRRGEGEGTRGGWGLPINAAAAAATTPDDPDAERRDATRRRRERESAARKAWVRKAQSTSGVFARNPDTRCALPGDYRVRRDARRPLRHAGILAGVRNTHVRPLNFARLSWPDKRERHRGRGVYPVGENWPVQPALVTRRPVESRVSILILISGMLTRHEM